jgi:hypothetical protein
MFEFGKLIMKLACPMQHRRKYQAKILMKVRVLKLKNVNSKMFGSLFFGHIETFFMFLTFIMINKTFTFKLFLSSNKSGFASNIWSFPLTLPGQFYPAGIE